MFFFVRNLKRHKGSDRFPSENTDMEERVPASLMKDSAALATGNAYDRVSIEKVNSIPNDVTRRMARDRCKERQSDEVQIIPRSLALIEPKNMAEFQSEVMDAGRKIHYERCSALVKEICNKQKNNHENDIVTNGSAKILATGFENLAGESSKIYMGLLENILSVIVRMFPLEREIWTNLGSIVSLNCLIWILKNGNLAGRKSSILILKEFVISDKKNVQVLEEIEGLVEALFMLIREPICSATTKASLMVIFHLISPSASNTKFLSELLNLGFITLLLEILVDSNNSVCEKALGCLDNVCSFDIGRERLYANALTVPLLTKKLLRNSELSTTFAVSSLWKLCKNYNEKNDDRIFIECLQTGAFQKLLLLLQIGCSDCTKEKASQVLKLLNGYRGRLECVDSMDLKHLERQF